MAAARTGMAKINKNDVIKMLHTNNGRSFMNIASFLRNSMVQIKFIDAAIEDDPTRWKLRITKSTEDPGCPAIDDNGGYNVQPVPAPPSENADSIAKTSAGGDSQKLKLLSLGNAISGAPIRIGTEKLPNPPTAIGTTTKNSIRIPCEVTITL